METQKTVTRLKKLKILLTPALSDNKMSAMESCAKQNRKNRELNSSKKETEYGPTQLRIVIGKRL